MKKNKSDQGRLRVSRRLHAVVGWLSGFWWFLCHWRPCWIEWRSPRFHWALAMRLVARRSEIKHNIKLRMDPAIPDGQIHFVDDDTGHRQVFYVTANDKVVRSEGSKM